MLTTETVFLFFLPKNYLYSSFKYDLCLVTKSRHLNQTL